jgi:uncharacterized protein YdeI (YjbR/CyaY-like superfamily)
MLNLVSASNNKEIHVAALGVPTKKNARRRYDGEVSMAHDSKKATRFYAADRTAWRTWLENNHAASRGIWLIYDKGTTGQRTLSYDDIVDEALCFGWIDSLTHSFDDKQAMLYVSPRNPKSPWSKVNKQRVARLIDTGLMTDAGLAVVETSKANGSWTSYDAVEELIVPSDLAGALAGNKTAERNFEAFSASNKKQILWYIVSAKRPETRKKRIAQITAAAEQNINPLQYRTRKTG